MSGVTYSPVLIPHSKRPSLTLAAGNVVLTADDMQMFLFFHPSNGTNTVTLPSTAAIISTLHLTVGDAFTFELKNTGSGSSTLVAGDNNTTFTSGPRVKTTAVAGGTILFTFSCTSANPPALSVDSLVTGTSGISLYDNLVIYLATTGNDANDGLTPSTAVASLQQACNLLATYGYNITGTISVGAGSFPLPTTLNINLPLSGFQLNGPTISGAQSVLLASASVVGTVADANFQGMQLLTLQNGVTLPALPAGLTSYKGLVVQWVSGGAGSGEAGATYTIASGTPGGSTLTITEFTSAPTGVINILYPTTIFTANAGPVTVNFTHSSRLSVTFSGLRIDASSNVTWANGNVLFTMVLLTLTTSTAFHAFNNATVGTVATAAGLGVVASSPITNVNFGIKFGYQDSAVRISNSVFYNSIVSNSFASTLWFTNCYLEASILELGAPTGLSVAYVSTVVSVGSTGDAFWLVGNMNKAFFNAVTATGATNSGFNINSQAFLFHCIAVSNSAEGIRSSQPAVTIYLSGTTVNSNGSSPGSRTANGVFVDLGGSVEMWNGCVISSNIAGGVVVANGNLTCSTGAVSSNGTYGFQLQNGVGTLNGVTVSSNGTDGINVTGGAISLSTNTISNNVRDGLRLSNCKGTLNSGSGTGNGGYGLRLVQQASLGVNSTVAAPVGTLGAVLVGANAAATWATVQGGLTSNCCDYSAVSSAFCSITPINYGSRV